MDKYVPLTKLNINDDLADFVINKTRKQYINFQGIIDRNAINNFIKFLYDFSFWNPYDEIIFIQHYPGYEFDSCYKNYSHLRDYYCVFHNQTITH